METENLERTEREFAHARKVRLTMFLIAGAASVATGSVLVYLAIRGANPVGHGIAIVLSVFALVAWFVCLSRQRADTDAARKHLGKLKGIIGALHYRSNTDPRRRPRA